MTGKKGLPSRDIYGRWLMGLDSTPRSGNPEPDRPDGAPPWFLILIVVLVGVGALWFLWTFLNFSRPA